MATNNYQVEKVINDKKYVAQFAGLSVAIKAVDSSYIDGTSTTSIEKMAEYMFKHVIVEPANLSIDDFDSMEELNEVIAFARSVMQGGFRGEAVKGEASAKGRK